MHVQGFSRFVLIGSASFALAVGCKAKEKTSEEPEVKPPPAVVTPEPLPEPVIPDAAGPTALGEAPVVLLDGALSVKAEWTEADTRIVLRAAFAEGSDNDPKRSATIFATVGESAEAGVFTCKDLLMANGPRIEAMVRGSHVHLLCITPPKDGSTGFTDALRVSFDPAKMVLAETGSYGGEGVVDPDTIDLDEGEL